MTLGGAAVCFAAGLLAGLFGEMFLFFAVLTVAATAMGIWLYPRRFAESFAVSREGEWLTARYGVLRRSCRTVPLTDRCTVTRVTTPLQRYYHCTTVVIRFSGGRLILPLLEERTADALFQTQERGATP